MPNQYDVDVLIAGGGPTGLTLACELLRFGVNCMIIDKAEGISSQTKALGVMARTLEHLDRIGVAQEFVRRGHPIGLFNVYSGDHLLVRLDFHNTLKSPFPFVLMIPQNITEDILYSHFKKTGGEVKWNKSLTRFTHGETGVEAVLSDADGNKQTIKAKYLIGCDGAHSVVRHGLRLDFEGITLNQNFALADVTVDWHLPHNESFACIKDGQLVAYFPMKDGQHRILITTEGQENPDSPVTLEEFQKVINKVGPKGTTIHNPTWKSRFRINQRKVKRGNIGRVFLAGDAAHIHSPIGAQGMNTGIQDSINLAWKLAYVLKFQCSTNLLDSYSEEREPLWSTLTKGTDFATKMVLKDKHLFQLVRNTLAPKITSSKYVNLRLVKTISQVVLHYRHSPIVEESIGIRKNSPFKKNKKKMIFAGDRAPDVLINGYRLFELQSGLKLTILLFTNDLDIYNDINLKLMKQKVPYQIYQITSDSNKQIELEQLKAQYGIENDGIIVIRPDGYVGFISDNAYALLGHLEKIYVDL